MPSAALCEACLTGRYPTPAGEKLYQLALGHDPRSGVSRTYETVSR
jgi:amidophosphoribosyltransferase